MKMAWAYKLGKGVDADYGQAYCWFYLVARELSRGQAELVVQAAYQHDFIGGKISSLKRMNARKKATELRNLIDSKKKVDVSNQRPGE